MKTRAAFVLVVAFLLFTVASAQSVVITGKKVTYTRPKPQMEGKKTFTINYPKVRAASTSLSRKIESALSYGINLREELNDVQWLEEADYKVGYNRNWVLSVALTIEGTAAYPSSSTKHVVVNLRTGNKAIASDVFTNLPGLLRLVKNAKAKETAQAIVDIKKDPQMGEPNPEALFKEHGQYNPVTLKDLGISDKGVTFYYDYGFPHVIQALQPPGEFTFTWKQLRPYIKPGGLLARLAR